MITPLAKVAVTVTRMKKSLENALLSQIPQCALEHVTRASIWVRSLVDVIHAVTAILYFLIHATLRAGSNLRFQERDSVLRGKRS